MTAALALVPVVVVPDGLVADEMGRGTSRPSFVFRAVLDTVVKRYPENLVLVAPANNFNGPISEEEAGRRYLLERGCRKVLAPTRRGSPSRNYIDTRDNAKLLREWLEELLLWPIGPCILVSASLHARRAAICFRAEDFEIVRIESVFYEQEREPIVPRLFYYRHPLLHKLYERLALIRDSVRVALDLRKRLL